MRRLLALMGMLLACIAVAGEFKIIPLQHRFAQDLLPALQPLAGAGGVISGSGTHLFVDVSQERLPAIEQAVAQLDVESRSYRISIDRSGSAHLVSGRVEASGRIGDEVRIERNGSRRSGTGVTVEMDRRETAIQTRGSEYLNVQDGATAFIAVGQSVPYTEYWLSFVRRYAAVQQAVQYRDITTGFSVTPRQIGREVELEVAPRIASLRNDGVVEFQQLATVVRVAPGQWFNLGGALQEQDEVSRAILARGQESARSDSQLWLLVE